MGRRVFEALTVWRGMRWGGAMDAMDLEGMKVEGLVVEAEGEGQ